jgi:hypothetical protein
MICIFLRKGFISEGDNEVSGLPPKEISPEVGSMSLSKHLPNVDFPHPDSPTNPNVSPGSIEKLTVQKTSPSSGETSLLDFLLQPTPSKPQNSSPNDSAL